MGPDALSDLFAQRLYVGGFSGAKIDQEIGVFLADLRFAKPLDEAMIRKLSASHEVVVTVEEGAVGGLGAHVLTLASDSGLLDAGLKIRTLRLPDVFQAHDKPEKQYAEAGLDADAERIAGIACSASSLSPPAGWMSESTRIVSKL